MDSFSGVDGGDATGTTTSAGAADACSKVAGVFVRADALRPIFG